MSNDSIMAGLRRANPVPETPAAGNSDLFERITALPQDAPAAGRRERPTRRQRRGFILVLAALIAALLASTAFAIPQWLGGDLVEPPVTRQEYFDAQKELVLPPGARWPKPDVAPDDNSVTTRGGGGGRAVLIAMNAWECFWVDAIPGATPPQGNERMRSSSASLRTTCSKLRRVRRKTGSPRLSPLCHSRPSPTTGVDWIRRIYTQRPPAMRRGGRELPSERSIGRHPTQERREAPPGGASVMVPPRTGTEQEGDSMNRKAMFVTLALAMSVAGLVATIPGLAITGGEIDTVHKNVGLVRFTTSAGRFRAPAR